MDEQELVRKAAEGDTEAFEKLMLRYQKPIYNLALRTVGNAEDACDLAQEAFLRAWRSLGSVRSDGAFSTWLYRTTMNLCIDHLRASKRRKTVSLVMEDNGEEQTFDLPDTKPLPEEQVFAKADREAVRRAMDSLPIEHRQVLTLRILNDLPYEQIAEILQVPEGTIKSRIYRARTALAKKLQEIGNISLLSSSKKMKGRKRL